MAWARRITPLGPSRYETLGNSTVSFMISSSEFRDDLLGQEADRVDNPVERDLPAGVHVQRDARNAQLLAIFHDALRHRVRRPIGDAAQHVGVGRLAEALESLEGLRVGGAMEGRRAQAPAAHRARLGLAARLLGGVRDITRNL